MCRHIETVTVDNETSKDIVKPKWRLATALKTIVELKLHTGDRNVVSFLKKRTRMKHFAFCDILVNVSGFLHTPAHNCQKYLGNKTWCEPMPE